MNRFEEWEIEQGVSRDRRQAFDAYARAAVGFVETIERIRSGEDVVGSERRRDVEEAIRDLVDFCMAKPTLLLETIASVRHHERELAIDYAARHAANTCLYSLLLGAMLGLGRGELAELGIVALYADVGLAVLPKTATQRGTPFTNAERRSIRSLMLQGAQLLLQGQTPTPRLALRIVAAYEHHAPYRRRASAAPARRHPYSRIIAVADVYDALRAARPWRNPYLVADAFRAVWIERDGKFDPLVVEALRRLRELEALDDHVLANTEVRSFIRLEAPGACRGGARSGY